MTIKINKMAIPLLGICLLLTGCGQGVEGGEMGRDTREEQGIAAFWELGDPVIKVADLPGGSQAGASGDFQTGIPKEFQEDTPGQFRVDVPGGDAG